MKLTIHGTGYVGLVTGACMAEVGNDVLCVDIDADKIQQLLDGQIPIHEPGLAEIVSRNAAAGRLNFTTDIDVGVQHGILQIIAVGTPPGEDGSADLQHVLAVAESVGQRIDEYKVIVDKSTVPVGTAEKVQAEIAKALAERGTEV
ncbi:MAG: UDP-glucose 6-dehydrogenase, partial [Gammaproteobacteria bacterium]|nr:UDP-glucose 6-dehydrogenase [Gammaproteobacteria bacterium]